MERGGEEKREERRRGGARRRGGKRTREEEEGNRPPSPLSTRLVRFAGERNGDQVSELLARRALAQEGAPQPRYAALDHNKTPEVIRGDQPQPEVIRAVLFDGGGCVWIHLSAKAWAAGMPAETSRQHHAE